MLYYMANKKIFICVLCTIDFLMAKCNQYFEAYLPNI